MKAVYLNGENPIVIEGNSVDEISQKAINQYKVNPVNLYGTGFKDPSGIGSGNNAALSALGLSFPVSTVTQPAAVSTPISMPGYTPPVSSVPVAQTKVATNEQLLNTPSGQFFDVYFGNQDYNQNDLKNLASQYGMNYDNQLVDGKSWNTRLQEKIKSSLQTVTQQNGTIKNTYLGDANKPYQVIQGNTQEEINSNAIKSGINPVNLQPYSQQTQTKIDQGTPKFETPIEMPGYTPKIEDVIPNTDNILGGDTGTNLSEPKSPAITDSYFNSLTTQLANTTKTLTDAYQKQVDALATQKTEIQKQLDDLKTKQSNDISSYNSTVEAEKQAKLDYLDEEKIRFDENYNIVQGLSGQLNDLVTTGTNLINQQKGLTGLSSIRTPRINQTIADVAAQSGMIQAAISAYNGQMNQAQSQLQSATNSITSIYGDQIDYYKNILNLNQQNIGDSDTKLLNLDKEQKTYINSQIGILENQVNVAQSNLTNLQNAMTDPQTALVYAQAGVTLNDTPEMISQKLSKYAYQEEVNDLRNKATSSGLVYIPTSEQIASHPASEVSYQIDSKGIKHYFYKPTVVKATSGTGGGTTPAKSSIIVETEKGTQLDLLSVAGIKQAISEGYNPADIRLKLNSIKGMDVNSVNALIEEATKTEESKFLSTDYFKSLYTEDQLKQSAKESGFTSGGSGVLGFLGFGVGEKGINDYLNYLMSIVEQYRKSGMSDSEILKQMQ